MADKIISRVGYLVGGLGVGSLIGILLAPKSGDEIREYLTNKAKQGREYAENQARDLKDRAEEILECGKDGFAPKGKLIATAVSVGREAYRRECELAKRRK